jgi:hypothetical protein
MEKTLEERLQEEQVQQMKIQLAYLKIQYGLSTGIYQIKGITALRNNKEILLKYLKCLIYMLYNINLGHTSNRRLYRTIYSRIIFYSNKYIYGVQGYKTRETRKFDNFTEFINKKSKICDKGKSGVILSYWSYTDSRKPSANILSNKAEVIKLLDECELTDQNLNFKILKLDITEFTDNVKDGGHQNSLIIRGTQVFRVEPNINIMIPINYFLTNKQFYLVYDKLSPTEKFGFKVSLNTQFETDNFKLGDYTLNGVPVSDPVNKALYDFFSGTGYTFEGFLPDKINYCSSGHGGMCLPISAALGSFHRDIDYPEMKYLTIKQCEKLFTEVSRLTFPPGTEKPVLDGPGEVIKKGDTTQEIIYICQFIKRFYDFSAYPGITLHVYQDVRVRYDLSKDLEFDKIITEDSSVLIKMNDYDPEKLKSPLSTQKISIGNIIQDGLLEILKTSSIRLADLEEEHNMLARPHVSFGVKNKLKQIEAEIRYIIQCV